MRHIFLPVVFAAILLQPASASLPTTDVTTVSLRLGGSDYWHTVGPDTAPYWTGTCIRDEVNNLHGKSDNTIKVEHIVWLGTPRAETTRCGWMKFNTTPIPDGAVILSARIRYLVHFWLMSFDFQFTAVDVDPVRTGARDLYEAVENGTVCADIPMGRLWDTTDLNAAGVASVQNSLTRDWVAFGLWGYDWSSIMTEKAWITGWNNNPREDSPWLDVDYSITSVAEPYRPAHAGGRIAPTIVSGVLFLAGASSRKPQAASLLDAAGRKARELRPGANDVSRLAPGVYFVRLDERGFDRVVVVR